MPEGEPTQNNLIEGVLTGPKGFWGARARNFGLPPTAANRTRRTRRPSKREQVYMRPVPESNRAIRFRNPGGVFNNVEQQLLKGDVRIANNYTEKYNGKTLQNIHAMPRAERKEFESKMSHDTYVKYASNSFRITIKDLPIQFIVAMPWPHFRNLLNSLEYQDQNRILKFMQVIYFRIQQKKVKKKFGGLTLEEIGKQADDEREEFLLSLPREESSKLFAELYGDFGGKTLSEIVNDLEKGRPGSSLEEREDEYMSFIRSFPPAKMREIIFLVNLYILYYHMRGKELPGYSDGKWNVDL